jgi:hypothetical protein
MPISYSKVKGNVQQQSLQDSLTDTAKNTTLVINDKFNGIYLQNSRPSVFGNEYGNILSTQLVADLVGNFVVFNTPKSRFSFIFNPRVKLRLLATAGAPVKSPSYMPGGTLYFRTNGNYIKPRFLSLSYTHHSNGIRGPTLNADGSFNRDTGKFTTNYYTLTYTTGKQVDRGNLISNRYQSIGLELHAALVGLGYAKALKDKYGFVRLNSSYLFNLARAKPDYINTNMRTFNNWMRLQVDFQYILDKYNNYDIADIKKRLNIGANYYYQFPFMKNVALMVGGGYRGQDDYNIFFEDSYAYFTIGLAAGVSFGFNHKGKH